MRSALLASCVALILIYHSADSASIKSARKSNVAKGVENANQLGRKLTAQDQSATTELIALLKAKISGKHFREAETCPSSEILDLESDAFGLFLYPSSEDDEETTLGDEQADDNDESEDDNEDAEGNDGETEDGGNDAAGLESSDEPNEDEDDNEDAEGNDGETEDEGNDTDGDNNEEVNQNDAVDGENGGEQNEETGKHWQKSTKRSGPVKKSLKANEYEELINLIRHNIDRETSIKRSKRSVRANKYLSARGVNDARTEVQCSHVIKTTQKVITVIVLAEECQNGEVRLYNGEDNSSENPHVVPCGQTEPAVLNADGSVYIEYEYDSSSSYGGFGLLWVGSN